MDSVISHLRSRLDLRLSSLRRISESSQVINYVSAHDNETLYDNTVWKMPASLFSPAQTHR